MELLYLGKGGGGTPPVKVLEHILSAERERERDRKRGREREATELSLTSLAGPYPLLSV